MEDDRLPVIAGIAREIQSRNKFHYIAGIWLEDIRSLTWHAYGDGQPSKKYRAPSWSWAALDYSLGTYDIYTLGGTEYEPKKDIRSANILRSKLKHQDGDPFGCTKSGYIVLQGHMLLAAEWKGITPPHYTAYWKKSASHMFAHLLKMVEVDRLVFILDQFPPGSDEATVDLNAVYLLQLATYDWSMGNADPVTLALLLERAGSSGSYRRIGIAEVPNHERLADDGWEVKDVTII